VEEVVGAQSGLEMYFYICVPRLGEDSKFSETWISFVTPSVLRFSKLFGFSALKMP
jgi:hypothetical protein